MGNFAIRVEKISKKYKIGDAGQKTQRMLRYFIQEHASNGIRALGGKLGLTQKAPGIRHPAGAFWALQDVSFDVHAGDSIGIIGSNGAGKSTLLKIISRITSPTSGRLRLRGRVGSLLEVGTGFHQDLTGRENVYLNGAILGMRRREINRKFDEIVAFSGVESFLDTQVKYYSTGMKMRLAFSVAAHLDPEILLIDEVLAVGDAAFQRKSLGKMSNVIGDGRTVLFVSHNIAAVRALCRKAIYIEKGRIQSMGKVDEVAHTYLKTREAGSVDHKLSDIDPTRSAQVLSAIVLDRAAQPSDSLPHDQPFSIRLKIAIHKPRSQLYVSLKIYTQELENILVSHDFEQDENKLLSREPGIYTADVKIPAPLLPPGRYLLGFAISRTKTTGQSKIQEIEHTTPFDIYDNGSLLAKTNIPWKGLVHVPIIWKDLETNET